MADKNKQQMDIAERLQTKLLQRWEKLIDEGTLQATDAATLARLLRENGWSIDPNKVPVGLRGILTSGIDASTLDEDNLYGKGH